MLVLNIIKMNLKSFLKWNLNYRKNIFFMNTSVVLSVNIYWLINWRTSLKFGIISESIAIVT